MKTTVMIPCRNEGENIAAIVRRTKQFAERVIVANDSSTDNTGVAAAAAGAIVFDVPPDRHGLTGTYTAGLRRAVEIAGVNSIILEMDAGGSHAPEDIPKFVGAISRGASVATARRFGGDGASYEGHWRRKALSYVGTVVTNAMHGTAFKDATSGFVAYTGWALNAILARPWKSSGHFYQTEMRLHALALGLRMVEVPIVYKNSGSSLNWKSIAEAAKLVLP